MRSMIVAVLLFLALPRAAFADTVWIAVVGGDTRALAPKTPSGYTNSSFEVELTKVAVKDVRVARGELTFAGQHYAPPEGTFVASVAERDGKTFIDFTLPGVLKGGTYEARVVATTKDNAPQTLPLRLIAPTPVAKTPATLYLEEADGTLNVVETTGLAQLSGLHMDQLGKASMDGHDASGEVKEKADITVPAGRSGALAVTAKDFELGTSTGTLLLTANELAEPIDVRFEVRKRLGSWLVVVLIVAGLLLGLVVREILGPLMDKGAKVEEAGELEEELKTAWARHADADTRKAIEVALAALDTAVKGGAGKIGTAIDTQRKALNTALTTLDGKMAEAWKKLADITAVMDKSWFLPSALASALARETAKLATVRAFLEDDDAGGATAALAAVRRNLTISMATRGAAWAGAIHSDLETLPPAARASTEDDEAFTAIERALKEAEAACTKPDPDAETILNAIHAARLRVAGYVRRVVKAFDAEARNAATQFEGRPSAAEAFAPLWRELEALAKEASEATDGPEDVLHRVRRTFDEKLAAAMKAVKGVAAKDVERAAKHMEAGDYEAAAKMVVDATPEKLGSGGQEAAPASPLGPELDMKAAPPIAEPEARAAMPPRSRVRRYRETAVRHGKIARRVQRVVTFVLLTTSGYAFFAPNFVGHMGEIITILFWAFSLNIGIDTVLEQSKKLAPTRASEGSHE